MNVYRMILVLAGVLLLAPACRAQRLSAATRAGLAKVRHSRMGRSNTVGLGVGMGCPADTTSQFRLCGASNTELSYLANRLKPSLRCYAFSILVQRRAPQVFPLLVRHLRDNRPVWERSVHTSRKVPVGDFWLSLVAPSRPDSAGYTLTPAQRLVVDSLLLYGPGVGLWAKTALLEKLPPAPRYYRRVQQLARRTSGFPGALLPLSQYQRAQDIALIRRSLGYRGTQKSHRGSYALRSVRNYPQEAYYPRLHRLLKRHLRWKYYNREVCWQLFQALARYPRAETVALFEQVFQLPDQWRRDWMQECLQAAILKYPHPQWAALSSRLHLTEQQQRQVKEYLETP